MNMFNGNLYTEILYQINENLLEFFLTEEKLN